MKTSATNYAACLRQDILHRAETYVTSRGLEPHVYRSRGEVPTVLFRAYESGGKPCHGNFHDESFAGITLRPSWVSRLEKPHSGKRRCFLDCDASTAREMDSCTSSDALAMNIFCHPSSITNQSLARIFGFDPLPEPDFGFKANLPFAVGGMEPRSTEVDVRLHSSTRTVLAECKLTEPNFTACPRAHVERYAAFDQTFDVAHLPQKDGQFLHYQLIRNVLAARHHEASFTLICDQRRPDLQEAFGTVVSAIVDPRLRLRCSVITWQQIAATLPMSLQTFLSAKYGIEGHEDPSGATDGLG
ncbi:MAG: hypothetical protein GX590_01565 [Lentisphaerae bacterium]|nr:hypothetical protein [Lentisphaerota bacterium]